MTGRGTLAAALVAFAGGAAAAQTGFTPVSELPGVVEPPSGVVPINAGQVLSGMAPWYVIQRQMTQPGGHMRTAVTSDFVSFVDLPYTPDLNGDILAGVSDDGQRVVVTLTSTNTSRTRRIAYWTPGSSPTVVNLDSQFNQNAAGVSVDGRWIAGSSGVLTSSHAWRIDTQGSAELIDGNGEGGDEAVSQCISTDGAWVAGGVGGAPGPRFLWSAETGHEFLDSGVVHKPLPVLMSDGARVILCQSEEAGGSNQWITPIRVMGQWSNQPWSAPAPLPVNFEFVRPDGGLAGGSRGFVAVLWSPTLGVVDCGTELRARGIDTRGWVLTHVRFCSPDGRTLVGQGHVPASSVERWWVAHVEPFAAADIGKAGGLGGSDGKLDNNDFIVFIDRFFAQDERADVGVAGGIRGKDGVLDNNDFTAFISLFFNGQP